MPEIMCGKSQAFLTDLHKPAGLRIFVQIMICCLLEMLPSEASYSALSAVLTRTNAASKDCDERLSHL
jgi:hypothetical protein